MLIDPFGGLADLAGGVLRTPLDPDVSFSDDPLRMLRAARFMARFGLVPVPELTAAVEAGADRLSIVSAERIRDELCKLVMAPDPSVGLWFVHDSGLADLFLPELPAMRLEQDPIHRHKDVLSHTIAVVAKSRRDLKVRLAALFHDVGKPKTRSIGGKGVSFHHHEVVGARMTRDRMRALRFSNEMVDDVTQLVYLHLRFHTYQMGWTDAAVRRFVRDAGDHAGGAAGPDPGRLHHPEPAQGGGARAAHRRPGAAHRGAPAGRGARCHPAGPGRHRRDGAPGTAPGTAGG